MVCSMNSCEFLQNMEPEKEMATHFSILAWRIPGTKEPGGLLSMGSHRVGHDWSDLAAAAAAEDGFENTLKLTVGIRREGGPVGDYPLWTCGVSYSV